MLVCCECCVETDDGSPEITYWICDDCMIEIGDD